MFTNTPAIKHLVLTHKIFINAVDKNDPGYTILKAALVEIICSQPSWGEKLPKAWIPLQLAINTNVEDGVRILSIEKLREVNKENPVQVLSEKELQVFLKLLHSQGDIIHFPLPGLRDFIILSPSYFVDVLRSLVTDSSFCKGSRRRTVEMINKNGILKKEDIDKIWKKKPEFMKHKNHLLPLMEHLDILANPRQYKETGDLMTADFYYVPSLVKTLDQSNYLKQGLESRMIGLSFKFHSVVMPPAIGYRLIASCLDMYDVKTYDGQLMLFSGMVVVRVQKALDLLIQMKHDRIDIFLIHETSRFHIIPDVATGISECLNDVLMRISDSYNTVSSGTGAEKLIPFHIEY